MRAHKNNISFSFHLIGWLVIALIVVGAVGLTVEIGARIFLPNINVLLTIATATEDERHYQLMPNASTLYSGLYEKSANQIEWRINPQGIRSDNIVKNKLSDDFRIVSYGDSETFGWSVELDDTWQVQMEKQDPGVDVVNMGVPGYNIASIARHVEKTLPDLQADMVIYLFNKNDVYKSLNYHPQLSKSYFYLIANMSLYQLKAKQRKEWRSSDQGIEYFRSHLQRIIDACKKQDIPLIIAVQHWKYAYVLPEELQSDQYSTYEIATNNKPMLQTINVENVIDNYPRRDAHMTEPAHLALAQYLCQFLSSGIDKRCRPL